MIYIQETTADEREMVSLFHKLTKDERIAYLEKLRKVVKKK